MNNQHTINRIKELRVDALYGKKKHYNAADRKSNYNLWLGLPALIINILLGSLIVGFLSDSFPTFGKWVVSFITLISAILIGVQTFFNFQKAAEGHRTIATRYLAVAKQCNRLLAYFSDGNMDINILHEQLETLGKEYDTICRDAEAFPTSYKDYKKAQQGFVEEEHYLDKELNYRGE